MLSWLRRRRQRAERVEAEADRLMREHGFDAYGEARRREQEAKSKLEAKVWSRAAQAIAQETATRFDLNNATASDADLVTVREAVPSPPSFAVPDSNHLDKLIHVISGGSAARQYRLQFLGAGTGRGLRVLEEIGIHATDVSRAIRQAIHIAWPQQAIGFRLFDHEGREVFRRQNDDPYS